MATYVNIYSGGDYFGSGERMFVRLYPNQSGQDTNCQLGSDITTALRDAMEQLLNWGAISYYEVSHFDTTDFQHNHPGVNTSDSGTIADQFETYLTNGVANGTGQDLKQDYVGAHTLVHGDTCAPGKAAFETGEGCNGLAFDRGVMAWTGVCADTGLRKNSAIQEPLHVFIRWDNPNVEPMLGEDDSVYGNTRYDEHSLGRIESNGNVTPMLTYHAGDWSNDNGTCQNHSTSDDGYTTDLTWCTMDAVQSTANETC